MRPEIVFTVLLILALSAVLNYALCVIAAEAEEKAEMERAKLEKEKQKKTPILVWKDGDREFFAEDIQDRTENKNE